MLSDLDKKKFWADFKEFALIPIPWFGPPTTTCWRWSGKTFASGYGRTWQPSRQKPARAHRVIWEIMNGPIPDGISVCHRCDEPSCVNPDHLFLGTHSDNMKDCRTKGRMRSWPKGKGRKISKELAAAIKKEPGKQRDVAAKFGVSQWAVWDIKRGSPRL